ncbi:MAG: NADH-quinone oxidoreductase subunit H [Planctomycetes bacterium]|nr:NADH-quinone oxidoreductase subunit H [Planctomycetota bacterium]
MVTKDVLYKLVVFLATVGIAVGLVPIMTIVERRVAAFIQNRWGPNRVGPWGLLQPVADGIKAFFKEEFVPARADRLLHFIAPMLVFVPPAIGFAVIPWGNQIGSVKLQAVNLNIGVLFMMSVLSIAVYGLAIGGWASNNKWSLLGGLRASAQLISYELTLGLAILVAIMMAESVDPQVIVAKQTRGILSWNVFGGGNLLALPCGLLGILLLYTAALAENNRLPFDLPECEQELVGGYHTEYSSMKFAMFFMGEYVAMVNMSAIVTMLYLGGWYFPGITNPADHSWLGGILSVGVFMAKTFAILFVYVWIRWTFPRFKYNQLMNLGWKGLLPLSLANVALLAVVGVFTGGKP